MAFITDSYTQGTFCKKRARHQSIAWNRCSLSEAGQRLLQKLLCEATHAVNPPIKSRLGDPMWAFCWVMSKKESLYTEQVIIAALRLSVKRCINSQQKESVHGGWTVHMLCVAHWPWSIHVQALEIEAWQLPFLFKGPSLRPDVVTWDRGAHEQIDKAGDWTPLAAPQRSHFSQKSMPDSMSIQGVSLDWNTFGQVCWWVPGCWAHCYKS